MTQCTSEDEMIEYRLKPIQEPRSEVGTGRGGGGGGGGGGGEGGNRNGGETLVDAQWSSIVGIAGLPAYVGGGRGGVSVCSHSHPFSAELARGPTCGRDRDDHGINAYIYIYVSYVYIYIYV
jgi:hypothetical protein